MNIESNAKCRRCSECRDTDNPDAANCIMCKGDGVVMTGTDPDWEKDV